MEVMRLLVRRYVTAEQKKSEESEVTEDDVNEIKQDISSFRFELIDILKDNGMKTAAAGNKENAGQPFSLNKFEIPSKTVNTAAFNANKQST